ncbi:hypothetical protein O181_025413 [Austropuccinia psidii MF-1]|uniref:Uncharacterized protein n=1 Tax=Austropuccinia psidii MF-1 TaxID=1389203 RepID=A0A9Q3CMR1_9BASI|nr:hypothetical protein [Austropuccinia psidii MF-1]
MSSSGKWIGGGIKSGAECSFEGEICGVDRCLQAVVTQPIHYLLHKLHWSSVAQTVLIISILINSFDLDNLRLIRSKIALVVSDSIAQFVSITGIASDQARFFVESAGGDLETALSTYYETVGTTNAGAADTTSSVTLPAPTASSTGPTTLSGQPADEIPSEWQRPALNSRSSNRNSNRSGGVKTFGDLSGSTHSAPSSRNRGVSTLKDINTFSGTSGSADMSEDDDDDETGAPPDLYAGGGRSGLNVQDPNQQSGGKAGGIVADILKKAKEAGSASPPTNPSSNKKNPSFFQGPAQTLGSDQVPSQPVPAASQPRSARKTVFPTALSVPGHFGSDLDDEDNDEDDEEVEKHLTFWKDGFSIEDGPLLNYDDPKNKEILDAINRGRAPLDLLGVRLNQRVTMRVQKRLTENYIPPPKPPAKPFAGSGNRLGSPLPATFARPADTQSSRPAPSSDRTMIFEVDNNLPITSVQIRLADGTRMVTRFNHTHTIGDIRRQIASSNPNLANRPYALQTTFPSRDLTDDNQTVKEAGILGAVVVQRFT